MKLMVTVGRSKFAEQTRITSRPPITEKQIERESVWQYGYVPDILAAMLVFYFGCFNNMPWFDWRAIFVQFLIHITIVEFIYYWAHRILHFGWIYKRYHQYHHASINTEPTTSVSFEMGERIVYTILFSVTPILSYYLGYQSYITFAYQLLWFDFQNGCGHINFEFFPKWLIDTPLWYFWYTASYHSIHHTKFKKNYSLFMPWPDMLFGTADMKLTRDVFTKALEGTPYVPSQQTVNENLDEKNLQIV
jgi:aldehyde decarbonylase